MRKELELFKSELAPVVQVFGKETVYKWLDNIFEFNIIDCGLDTQVATVDGVQYSGYADCDSGIYGDGHGLMGYSRFSSSIEYNDWEIEIEWENSEGDFCINEITVTAPEKDIMNNYSKYF